MITLSLAAFFLTSAQLAGDLSPVEAGFGFELVSPRASWLYTDGEAPDVRARVSGAVEEVNVRWEARQTEGAWRESGRLRLTPRDGRAEARLDFAPPSRGHYVVSATARCAGQTVTAETTLGIVFPPGETSRESPWGIFHIPHATEGMDVDESADALAESMRLLGASWARLNFWAHSYEDIRISREGGQVKVTADVSRWKTYAQALRRQGIYIMGEIAQCPSPLSSRRGAASQNLDMGPVENRVRPRDYADWDALMTWLAAEFRDEIDVWEIWNEPGFTPGFWVGTPEEFAELVRHTSAALRRGDPEARIAGCGFADSHAFADRVFELGAGDELDILSVHYTDASPGGITAWRAVLETHGLDLPLWNTEERPAAPLNNLAYGIEKSFKFLHVGIPGYEAFQPLVDLELAPRPSALWFATAAHCLGPAEYEGRGRDIPGYEVYIFRRGREVIAAFRAKPFRNLFGVDTRTRLEVQAASLDEAGAPLLTDRYGRSGEMSLDGGRATILIDSSLMFLNGLQDFEIMSAESEPVDRPGWRIFEAEAGRFTGPWSVEENEAYSGGGYAEIWTDEPPGDARYSVEIPFDVAEGGRHQLYFSGNSLTRLAEPRSLSPFTWSVDDGPTHPVDGPIAAAPEAANAGEGLYPLGAVRLEPGRHTFRLKLAAPREEPDNGYALWFDAIVARRAPEDQPCAHRRERRAGPPA